MTTPLEALDRLDQHARELGDLSTALMEVSRRLEEVDREYQRFVDDFEIGLYLKSEEENGPKFPSEAMRLKLARREMNPEVLGRRDGLERKRERLKQRIGDLKAIVESERSVLSALRIELEATAPTMKRAA